MTQHDRVAWLIPVRDGASWLGEAVASALAECAPGDEVVVVDDGSLDHPARVLPRDGRVKLYARPHRGIVGALEFGRRQTDAPYLARLDCDDLAIPGRIAAQRALLDSRPEVAVVGGRAVEEGLPEGMRRYVAWVNGLEDLHREILVESPLVHPGTLLRAAAVEDVGGYRDGDFPEDYDLWLRLAVRWRLAAVAQTVVFARSSSPACVAWRSGARGRRVPHGSDGSRTWDLRSARPSTTTPDGRSTAYRFAPANRSRTSTLNDFSWRWARAAPVPKSGRSWHNYARISARACTGGRWREGVPARCRGTASRPAAVAPR